ncbi:LLM class flavin-dependent oxidoreductase [soil metagenome]
MFHLYLPQMRMSLQTLAERAQVAEAVGFEGISLMDHLAPPLAMDQPMHEAITTAMWLAAHTTTLKIGHLVLCDAFRHPAVLARQVVDLDHASGGRFELGLGWGSVPDELVQFGVTDARPPARLRRLRESVEVIEALFTGEPVDYDGEFHHLTGAVQRPTPQGAVPLIIGGAGPGALDLAAGHATWWNLPTYAAARLDELLPQAAPARASVQQMIAFVPSETERAGITELAMRRFGAMGDGLVIGTADELVDQYRELAQRGVERFYVWFTDFAQPHTLTAFAADVIGPVTQA